MGDRLGQPGAVYTRTCVQRCYLVGLRKPRKSDGSSDWPIVERKRTSMDVGAVSIRRHSRKSTVYEYLAHQANLLRMKNSLMRLNGSSPVYLPGDWVGIWMKTGLAKLLSLLSALNSLRLDTCVKYKISFIDSKRMKHVKVNLVTRAIKIGNSYSNVKLQHPYNAVNADIFVFKL